jgi:hypothetical protein
MRLHSFPTRRSSDLHTELDSARAQATLTVQGTGFFFFLSFPVSLYCYDFGNSIMLRQSKIFSEVKIMLVANHFIVY